MANDDLKAQMREALERKNPHDDVADRPQHRKERGPETHGPQGGAHMHRRKAGGGGA